METSVGRARGGGYWVGWAGLLASGILLAAQAAGIRAAPIAKPPLVIGLSAEYGVKGSEAALSIERGIRIAIDEINQAGGVLGGRRLALETRDDRGVPMRGVDNLREFAAKPEVVAVMCGRFSPVALDQAPVANELGITMLDPWAAADGITRQNGKRGNYIFRLSLTDTWAIKALLDHARGRGFKRIAAMFPNTAWGRSSEAAMLTYLQRHPGLSHSTYWYNWGDQDYTRQLLEAKAIRPDAILMVANEAEGALIIRQLAALQSKPRYPVLSHWGIAGGDLVGRVGKGWNLGGVDLVLPQSFGFEDAAQRPGRKRIQEVAARYRARFGEDARAMHAQVGFAHAYDLTHMLARAIQRAGVDDRAKIRDALEDLDELKGLVRDYKRPFSPQDHEALDEDAAYMATYNRAGRLQRIKVRP